MFEQLIALGIPAEVAQLVALVDWCALGRDDQAPADHGFMSSGLVGSSPYDVGVLLAALGCVKGKRVLEIGTGAGALCSALLLAGARVTSLDLRPVVISGADCHQQNGYLGWPSSAPYDAIVCGACVRSVPDAWFEQAPVGVIVVPAGRGLKQELLRFTQSDGGRVQRESLGRVAFNPLER